MRLERLGAWKAACDEPKAFRVKGYRARWGQTAISVSFISDRDGDRGFVLSPSAHTGSRAVQLFGINYDDARLVQLTDGGHYENLGLVEALRRRCRLIFCIDAGGDAPPLLSTLSDAMRLAEYELGVTIELNEHGPYSVNNIAPGSGKPFPEGHALARLNGRLAKGTVAFGTIKYPMAAGLTKPQNPRGVLIFAKAVLWEGCPELLLTYAASSEVFPHDPTSDQWFNEAQFAAYTALGKIMGKHAVGCAESVKRAGLI
jgi:hypothetical protein